MSSSAPRRIRTLLLLVLLVTSVVAGCVSAPERQPEFRATATTGSVYTGWGYAGGGVSLGNESRVTLTVDEETNVGSVHVEGIWFEPGDGPDDAVRFTLDHNVFMHNEDDFHSGGVAANFDEHGDSGVGDTNLPRMHLLLATWGTGTMSFNGTRLNDTYTGGSQWAMHLMVTDTGIRDDEAGTVSNAAGSPYDPASPGDAVIGDDLELMIVVTSPYANETRPADNGTVEGTLEPQSSTGRTIEVLSAGARLNVTIDFGGDQGELGPYTARLEDPDGMTIASGSLTIPGIAQGESTISLSAQASTIGPHRLVVGATVAGGDFTGTYDVVYPAKNRFVFHFEDVDVVQRVV